MIYSASITTSAATAKADAVETVIALTRGLIWQIQIEFPSGCCGLAHIQIFDGLYQVFPATPGDSIHSEGAVLSFDDLYLKNAAPFLLTVRTWNLDDTWDHTLQVRIGLASSEAFMSRYMPSLSWDKFNKSMQAAAIEQERVKIEQLRLLSEQLGGL